MMPGLPRERPHAIESPHAPMLRSILSLTLLAAVAAPATPATPQGQLSGRRDDRAHARTLPLDELRTMLAAEGAHTPFVPPSPLGLPPLDASIPKDNPLTPAKVELGRQLYFDKRLSRDGSVSCATCHDPALGWTDGAPVSTGMAGQRGARSAPTVVNRVLGKTQFWDGRAASLEEQAVGPIHNPIEMGFTHDEVVTRLNGIEGYRLQFDAVFGSAASIALAGKALASFERTIVSGANKNDYFESALPLFDFEPDDDEDPAFLAEVQRKLDLELTHRMSPSAERGRGLFFGKASCSACHVGSDLTDELFHNIGVGYAPGQTPDAGRFEATANETERGAFKTPTVRNIVLTDPYMHDGSLATLMEVVEHYDRGGNDNPWLSEKISPLNLSPQEKQDLVRFMEEALTGPVTEVEVPRLP